MASILTPKLLAVIRGENPSFHYEFVRPLSITNSVWLATDKLDQDDVRAYSATLSSRDTLQVTVKQKQVVIKIGDASDNLCLNGEFKILHHLVNTGEKAAKHLLAPARVIPADKALGLEHPPFLVFPFIADATDFVSIIESGVRGEDLANKWSGVLFDLLVLLEKGRIIHRDISPNNILIDSHDHLYLIDFERAVSIDEPIDNLHFFGTRGYMSPEVSEKRDEQTTAADQYSLAAVLLFLLTGIKPINVGAGNNLQNLFAALAADLHPVLQKAMAENPQDRYANVEAFRDAWDEVFACRAKVIEIQGQVVEEGAMRATSEGYKVLVNRKTRIVSYKDVLTMLFSLMTVAGLFTSAYFILHMELLQVYLNGGRFSLYGIAALAVASYGIFIQANFLLVVGLNSKEDLSFDKVKPRSVSGKITHWYFSIVNGAIPRLIVFFSMLPITMVLGTLVIKLIGTRPDDNMSYIILALLTISFAGLFFFYIIKGDYNFQVLRKKMIDY